MSYAAWFINILCWILIITILARSIMSWVVQDSSNPLVAIVYHLTEPVLGPIRRMLPNFGGLDLSPVVAIIIIYIIQRIAGYFLT